MVDIACVGRLENTIIVPIGFAAGLQKCKDEADSAKHCTHFRPIFFDPTLVCHQYFADSA